MVTCVNFVKFKLTLSDFQVTVLHIATKHLLNTVLMKNLKLSQENPKKKARRVVLRHI